MLHYNAALKNFLLWSVKLMEYIFCALSLCSNPCIGPLPKIKLSIFLLWIFVDELMSTPKKYYVSPNSVLGNEKRPSLSNPIPYPENPYLSISAFLVNLTATQVNNFLMSDNRWCWCFCLSHKQCKCLLLFFD